MASVSQPFNHEETQRSVRHPLDVVRTHIRRYVILEGTALAVLVMAGLFWLGLLFDFGMYKFDVDLFNIHGIDWIQELNDVDSTFSSSYWVRVIVLSAVIVGLSVLGITKVVLRWVREFNDRAIALVLERRFNRELGDRLITAVELSDPTLSKKYGFSQAMVEKTITEAVAALERLPVAAVFNWRRLYSLWMWVGFSTVGVWLVVMLFVCVGSLANDAPLSPYGFAWRFYDVASIWAERNIMMMNTYWPRRAYLELGRFQPSKENPNEMRVARDDVRPDLQVRAFEWVVADRATTHGWRALQWADLPRFVDKDRMLNVVVPEDFPDWKIDPDELEPNLVAAIFGSETQARTSAEVREHLRQPEVMKKIAERGAQKLLDDWLDWTHWNVDKIWLQMEDGEVRRSLDNRAVHGPLYSQLLAVFDTLSEKAESPRMSRTLRKLVIPAAVDVTFRGEETGSHSVVNREAGNKFTVPLTDLKDSTRFRFRSRGEDFYTAPKTIVLVAAPTSSSITIDKEEPAYIYHRLKGVDQSPLRGLKHVTRDYGLSTTGDTNTIEVPFGTNLAIHVRTDRLLRADKAVFAKNPLVLEPGFDTFRGAIQLDPDARGFSLVMNNLSRKHHFDVEFFDEDNIRGTRRFKILSAIDTEPQLGSLAVNGVNLRKPKIKAAQVAQKDKDPAKSNDPEIHDFKDHAEIAAAFLITPDALVPFECMVKDDYGLVRAGYPFKVRKVDFELVSVGGKKSASQDVLQASRLLHAGAVVSAFQYLPANALSWRLGPEYVNLIGAIVQNDLSKSLGYREAYVPSEGFQDLLDRKEAKMIHLSELHKALTGRVTALTWEFDFKEDANLNSGFDVRKVTPEFKSSDPTKAEQFHYLLQVAVQASDNNVETGSSYRDEKGRLLLGSTKKNKNGWVSFLIVSENELLSQIAIEEETLLKKLEFAKERVDAGLVSLREQQGKFSEKEVLMEPILIRMNEIRTALASAGNNLRESHQAYENILREMNINRVRTDRVSKIRDKIIEPLDRIVNQGSFGKAEDSFTTTQQRVEQDSAVKAPPDSVPHQANFTEAGRNMQKLSDDIKLVLDAMSEGIDWRELVTSLTTIVDRQEGRTQMLSHLHREKVRETLEQLLKGLDGK